MNIPLFKQLEDYHILRQPIHTTRILSIDALRGFDMFWIIGGDFFFKNLNPVFHNAITKWIALQLDHSGWRGFTFFDLIMPLFLFIVGVSMPFSFGKRLSANPSKTKLWKHIIKRFIILWILGMVVQGNLLTYSFTRLFYYSNTLQAIAAGYLLSSILIVHCKVRFQVLFTTSFMLIYWLVMAFFPVPEGRNIYEPAANAALYIDELILGTHRDGSSITWILSSLNFGATTMLGVFAGYLLKSSINGYRKVALLATAGLLCYLLAIIWQPVHPVIKHLWTSSFVLYSGSFSLFLLALFYLVIGANAIFAYIADQLFDFTLIARIFVGGLQQYTGRWYDIILIASGYMVLYLILWYMYRKKIFIKI
jgi:predicted acyltransferase